MDDYKYLFKVVLLGEAGVGKTCLVRRFYQGIFPIGQAATIGVDFLIKTLEINGDKIKLQIWDTGIPILLSFLKQILSSYNTIN